LARSDLTNVSLESLQSLFGEPSADDMMCSSYRVDAGQAQELEAHVSNSIDLGRFDYYVSGWAEQGFRTPGGLYPPPKDPPAFIDGPVRIRPVPRDDAQ
jgi:hypothetical protein